MAPVYELSRVTRLYGSRRVVNIESLEVQPGEILAVVGPSGAGKSTLLRLLNFLEPPDGGIIRFHQQAMDTFHIPLQIQRCITTVFQNPALLTASVMTNLQFGLRLRGLRDGRKAIAQILDQLGLTHLKQAPAATLSGGEAQRVALARALVLQPEVLLLDEPTANLDPYNVELIESVIRELNSAHQVTMVLVTHNVFQACRLADRVALMLNGEIVEIADTQTFFEKPQDGRTRAFTRGEMVW